MAISSPNEAFDYVVVGSGFGGSVSALRLAEKGYHVLVVEKGKRFRDKDFATTNWKVWKYLWIPIARCFGILQLGFFRNVVVLHGAGVGGGSLGYAMVLEQPGDELYEAPPWRGLADWKSIMAPHYATAKRMLGLAENPREWPGDAILREIAEEMGRGATFRRTSVGAFFGEPGVEVPDPYFGGEGPARSGCRHCGACMVGCRYNAKNTLVKNYLYLAEKRGARVLAENEVTDVRPLPPNQPDGARYEVIYRSATAWFRKPERFVRARNVVFSAGVMGTLRLLFRCRDITGSLPDVSPRLGDYVRTNDEALLGIISRDDKSNYSEGVAITSIFHPDDVTHVEPVRYPDGSSLMRFLAGPLIEASSNTGARLLKVLQQAVSHPLDFLRLMVIPGWARRATILLVMRNVDTHMHVRLGRSLLTLFRRNLISQLSRDEYIPPESRIGHQITRAFAEKSNGVTAGSISEALLDVPMTAHILGGCTFGRSAEDGVIDLQCQMHNYPGLFVIDNSIIPANPGVNPSLTTTALAEYAMSHIPQKNGGAPAGR
jgi:cholesterol oxidase